MRLHHHLGAVALAAVLAGTLPAVPALAASYSDVPPDYPYASQVAYVSERGLLTGYGDGRFAVDDGLTAYQLATMLWRNAEPAEAARYAALGDVGRAMVANTTGLTDVQSGQWYTPGANWAVKNHVISGYSGVRFAGDEPLSTERFVTILARYANPEGLAATDASRLATCYADAGYIDGWAAQAAVWARDAGLLSGYPNADGTRSLRPAEAIPRWRAAVIIANAGESGVIKVSEPATPSEVETYTVAFTSQGRIIQSKRYKRGDAVAAPANPTREGYVFTGWSPDYSAVCAGDATYVATWFQVPEGSTTTTVVENPAADFYGIFYDGNGSGVDCGSQLGSVGKPVTLADMSALDAGGYHATGWNTKADGTGTHYDPGASVTDLAKGGESVTLYAELDPEYEVRLTEVDPDVPFQTYVWQTVRAKGGMQATLPTEMPNPGYYDHDEFVAWNTKRDGSGTPYAPGSTLAAKRGQIVTLYSIWQPRRTYTVRYEVPSGYSWDETVPFGTSFTVRDQQVEGYIEGYTVTGWKDATGKVWQPGDEITPGTEAGGTFVLMAQVEPKTYKLVFEDGYGGVTEQALTYAGKPFEVDLPAPAHDGKAFQGWQGSNWKTYNGKTTFDLSDFDDSGTLRLYANWTDAPDPLDQLTDIMDAYATLDTATGKVTLSSEPQDIPGTAKATTIQKKGALGDSTFLRQCQAKATSIELEEPMKLEGWGNGLFQGWTSLESVPGLARLDVSGCSSLGSMFSGDLMLRDVTPLSDWDTSSVMSFAYLFEGCESLADTSALSGWDTSSVTDMGGMFRSCESLADTSALSGWDTSSVTDMGGMFFDCSSLANVSGLGSWNTSSVTNMGDMFARCSKLTDVSNLGSWDTSIVRSMRNMFTMCENLEHVSTGDGTGGLTKWNVSAVIDMSGMFASDDKVMDFSSLEQWRRHPKANVAYMFDSQITNLPTWYTTMTS